MHTFLHGLRTLVSAIPGVLAYAVAILAGVGIFWGAVTIGGLRLLELRRLSKRRMIFLELTPPAFSDKTPEASQQFFADLHGFDSIRTVIDRLFARQMVFSVEVVGTRESGIRYLFCVPAELQGDFVRVIHSFDPDIRVRETEDYLDTSLRLSARIVEFGLKKRYYPLKTQMSYEDSDPMAFILSSFSKLQADEVIALQLVLTPTRVRSAEQISNRILYHHEHMDAIGGRRRLRAAALTRGLNTALFGMTNMVATCITDRLVRECGQTVVSRSINGR
jgi:hypothetical protein